MPDPVRTAGEIYLKSFSHEIVEDNTRVVDPEKEKYITWLKELFSTTKYSDEAIKLTYRTRELLVQILSVQLAQVSSPVNTSANILQDSRIVGSEDAGNASVLETLFPGYTLSGEVLRALVLAQPTSDTEELLRQQSLIKATMKAESLHNTLPETLKQLRAHEPSVVALFDNSDIIYSSEVRRLVEDYGDPTFRRSVYNMLASGVLQTTEVMLNVLYGMATLSVVVDPFLNKHYCSCKFLGGLVFSVFSLGVHSLYTGLDYYLKKLIHMDRAALYRTIRIRIDTLAYYIRQALSLQQIPDLPDDLGLKLDSREMALIETFLYGTEWLITKDPKAESGYLKKSAELLWYTQELKQTIAKMLYQSARVDMYLAIAGRMNSLDQYQGQLSFVEFRGHRPFINARGLWNPVLDPRHVVTNDITLETSDVCLSHNSHLPFIAGSCPAGSAPGHGNLLVTGCNASGKSTLMRAITVNSIFLAQTLGIAAAKSFQTGLFHAIYSHMDKYDQTGEFSSFEGELDHAIQMLEQGKALGIDQNMLVCFDELFSNTDPEESLYVTNRVLSAMAKQLRTINIVSSHYDVDTTDLTAENEFDRMHMHVERVNKTLIKTYQLKKGRNQQTNGLFHLIEKFRLFPDVYSELQRLILEGEE